MTLVQPALDSTGEWVLATKFYPSNGNGSTEYDLGPTAIRKSELSQVNCHMANILPGAEPEDPEVVLLDGIDIFTPGGGWQIIYGDYDAFIALLGIEAVS